MTQFSGQNLWFINNNSGMYGQGIRFNNCLHSYLGQNSLNTRNRFSKEEDSQLKLIVEEEFLKDEPIDWGIVSARMQGRSKRQCRERYQNYVKKVNNIKGNWTKEEDELLLEKVQELGRDWVKIQSFFAGRSNISLKNRYNCLIRVKASDRKDNDEEAIPQTNRIKNDEKSNKVAENTATEKPPISGSSNTNQIKPNEQDELIDYFESFGALDTVESFDSYDSIFSQDTNFDEFIF